MVEYKVTAEMFIDGLCLQLPSGRAKKIMHLLDEGAGDQIAATELVLYITNDGNLYRQMVQPIIKNLKKKKAKDQYDETKALKAWMNLADAGAKKYVKEFGGMYNTTFTKATRVLAAKELQDNYAEELED